MAAPLVAYYERVTPAGTNLRDEWRVREVREFDMADLYAAWGPDWLSYRPGASHVLEHRYIRDGAEEPWTPFQAANSEEQALQAVPDNAVALDSYLIELQALRKQAAEKRRKDEEEKSNRAHEATERAVQRKRSEEAFVKLQKSPRDGVWAEKWNAYAAAHQDDAFRARAQADPAYMEHYRAVIGAEAVPAKRKAIKEFLAYAEKHGFAGLGMLSAIYSPKPRPICSTCNRNVSAFESDSGTLIYGIHSSRTGRPCSSEDKYVCKSSGKVVPEAEARQWIPYAPGLRGMKRTKKNNPPYRLPGEKILPYARSVGERRGGPAVSPRLEYEDERDVPAHLRPLTGPESGSMTDRQVLVAVDTAKRALKSAETKAARALQAALSRAFTFFTGASDVEQAARANAIKRAERDYEIAVTRARQQYYVRLDEIRSYAGVWADMVPSRPSPNEPPLGDAKAARDLVKPARKLMQRQKLSQRQRPDDPEEDERVFDTAHEEWTDAAGEAWNTALDREKLTVPDALRGNPERPRYRDPGADLGALGGLPEAEAYVRKIHNPGKRRFAVDLLQHLARGGPKPEWDRAKYGLSSSMAFQAVSMQLRVLLGGALGAGGDDAQKRGGLKGPTEDAHLDRAFEAAEDGDCPRTERHLDAANASSAHRSQLLKRCRLSREGLTGTSAPARKGWLLVGLFLVAGVLLGRRGSTA